MIFNQTSFSRGVVIKFSDEKESKVFSDSFEEWTKDAARKGASLYMFMFFFFCWFFQKKEKKVFAVGIEYLPLCLYSSPNSNSIIHDCCL